MKIALAACNIFVDTNPFSWRADWVGAELKPERCRTFVGHAEAP